MHTLVRQKVLDIYRNIQTTHRGTFIELGRLRDFVRQRPDLEETCDIVAILKKAEDLARDTKAEILKSREQFEKVACTMYVGAGQLGEPVRTDWVTASPNAKSIPKLPTYKNNPEEYTALCRYFGVPDEVIQSQSFRPHYPGIVDYVTKCEAEMKPLPPGIDVKSLATQYIVTCRWKQGVEPDTLVEG